jgi:L-iditol 2-dehydrogenase
LTDGLAARLTGQGHFELARAPRLSGGEASSVVRVEAVGICGSDLHWFEQGGIGDAVITKPVILGHEFAGVVEEGPLRGRTVAVDPAIPCQACAVCAEGLPHLCPNLAFAGHGSTDGGLQEYVRWPSDLLHPLPDGMTSVAGAMLEPLGVAIHATTLGRVRVGRSAAVLGCGPIGLLLIALLRRSGAPLVVGVDPLAHRREAATVWGADVTASPDELSSDWWDTATGTGVDTAFDVSGSRDAVLIAVQSARPGGRVVLVGIPDDDFTTFPAALARRKGLTFAVSRRMDRTYPSAIRLAVDGLDLDSLVTGRYPLARVAEAFAQASQRSGLKVVVEPGRA